MSGTAEAAPGALFAPALNVFSHMDNAEGRLDPAERRRVVEEWNRTDAPYDARACIHTLFQAQAARTPDALAVTCEHRSLTYARLNERANRLAHHLVRLGVGPEARVGIGVKRGIDMVVAMLAVLKAGGAYVPLDPAYPAERLEFTLRDARVAVLLTEDALRGALPVPEGVRVVSLDQAAAEIARESAENLDNGVSPRGLAYLIYTSGSTGVPKGVAIEHESAVALLAWAAELHTAEELGGMLASTSICFDLSVYEIFLPLSLGGRIIVMENALALPHSAVAGQVRLVNTVPSAAAALLRTGGIPAGVTTVNLAGEPLRTELVDALYAHGIRRVYDLYGPSEDTTYSTYTLRRAGAPATIGRPISNTRAYVLDEAMQPVAPGVAGELYLGGRGLARGYLGRPSLTADRFIPDPFGPEAGGRLYRTGDLVRWMEESAEVRECVSAGGSSADADSRTDALTHSRTAVLEYLGRLDHQVKIRGFRVELGEIESALRRFPDVRDCVVVAREDTPGEKRLAAYLVGAAEPEALRAHLRRTLPEHFVPAAFVTLDEMPLTPNGKLDRKALPAPAFAADDAAYVAPRTPAEEVLAGAWAQALGVERVGVEDDVFQLGAESLVATRVVARIREAFGVELTVRAVFEAPTVAKLAERVQALRDEGRPALPPIVRRDDDEPAPLTFGQEGLWFLDRVQPGKSFYNVPAAARLSGPLDAAVLERALGEVVRRHDALRTVFPERQGTPVQVVSPFGGFALPVEELSALDEPEAEAARRTDDEAARPFELAAGPLFRARLLRLAADEHVLLMTMHHAVSDGWSLDVLYRELGTLYTAFLEGRPSPLPEPEVRFADYAAWQREQVRAGRMDAQLAWWTERLAGAPALLELPTDRPRPAVQSYRGARETVRFPEELAGGLEALARGAGGSLYMVVLAAWQVLLGRYAGTEDVVVGSPLAGRTRGEVQALVGFFTNTVVLRTDLSGDPAFAEVLRRVRQVTLGAYEHQDVPLETVVQALHPGRSLSHAPLFQVMFVQQTGGPGPEIRGVRAVVSETHPAGAKLDLLLSFTREAHGLRADLEYGTDVFERATVQRMLGHLRRVLEQVSADPGRPLSRLELLEDNERARVVEEWNRTQAAYPSTECIHHLFEAQAARTPDAVALVSEAQTLTYAALSERANRLAHHLRGRGIGAESRVGVLMERGVEMVVALLAVLKAGGAYVPLDPGYPAERLAYMLDDSAVPLVLTVDALRGALPQGVAAAVLAVDAEAARIAAEPAENPRGGAGPESLAYVIYTSGSTGRPKGVMNQHRGVVNRLCWMQAEFGLDAGDAVLQKTPFGFDVSVWEFFWPLMTGARLVMASPGGHRDPAYLQRVIETQGITTLHFVPSMLQQFVDTAEPARCTGLKRVVCSGEALPAALVRQFDARFPDAVALANLYGPTEAAVDVSCWHCARGESPDVVPIGRPVWNTALYVLDAALRPGPVGVPGELYIGGVQVARGYLNRPALTAERFVPDPFGAPGARLYRTGDRAKWRADGAVEYLGRLDDQVKIRGFRIEPGEVESVLRTHPAVHECAVVARRDAGDTRLVAYVRGEADAEALRAHLRRSLPEHMVPAAFMALDALPLSPNGKLDRKALPAPDFAAAARAYVAPRTPVEQALAEIWAELLGVPRVGVHDDFFELGGHSLLATRVVWRIRQALEGDVDVVALFESPTIDALAPRLSPRRAAAAASTAPARVNDERLLEMLDDLSDEELDRLLGANPDLQTFS